MHIRHRRSTHFTVRARTQLRRSERDGACVIFSTTGFSTRRPSLLIHGTERWCRRGAEETGGTGRFHREVCGERGYGCRYAEMVTSRWGMGVECGLK